jgi:hypothetical protein
VNAPTVTDFRNWTQLNLARYGFTTDEKVAVTLSRAIAYVMFMSGQKLDALDPSITPTGRVEDLEPLMQQTIQMRTEQIILQGRPGHVTSAADNEVIQSFTAGSYSESRRDPQRRGEQRSLNTWPALDELLWMIMTPERFSYWYGVVTGTPIASFAVEEIDWEHTGGSLTFWEPWDRYVLSGYDTVGM